ncbi:MAG: PT domain-containing protein [Kiritimatiellae bacterium]|nr:PT domain-containing protein [Kiritimatiellia bacterium]
MRPTDQPTNGPTDQPTNGPTDQRTHHYLPSRRLCPPRGTRSAPAMAASSPCHRMCWSRRSYLCQPSNLRR